MEVTVDMVGGGKGICESLLNCLLHEVTSHSLLDYSNSEQMPDAFCVVQCTSQLALHRFLNFKFANNYLSHKPQS